MSGNLSYLVPLTDAQIEALINLLAMMATEPMSKEKRVLYIRIKRILEHVIR